MIISVKCEYSIYTDAYSEEDEDIALRLRRMNLKDSGDGSMEIIRLWLGCIMNVDRIPSSRDCERLIR